jgi:hypothetical protein
MFETPQCRFYQFYHGGRPPRMADKFSAGILPLRAVGGRSASAPGLITKLSADPAIHGTVFGASVTRVDGEIFGFSIKQP